MNKQRSKTMRTEVKPQWTEAEIRIVLLVSTIEPFVSKSQLSTLVEGMRGEEKQFFFDKVTDIAGIIQDMALTFLQDGKGDNAIVYLHYFKNASDWYITEKDDGPKQHQAFGYVILNGDKDNAELGYISIVELMQYGVELDLYFKPCTLGEVKASKGITD